SPQLGVVSLHDLPSFVVADIPGLVEGAHRGIGLGHKFLKHIERTRLLVHLIDGSQILEDMESSIDQALEKMVQRYRAIRHELGLFNEKLLHEPEMVV